MVGGKYTDPVKNITLSVAVAVAMERIIFVSRGITAYSHLPERESSFSIWVEDIIILKINILL